MTRRRPEGWVVSLLAALLLVASSVTAGSAMGAGSITGLVFHDVVGDGLADGSAGGGANPGLAGVTVRLFHDDGATPDRPDAADTEAMAATATDSAGVYTFDALADGIYWVAVDSTSIAPGGAWAEQTWGAAGAVDATGVASSAGPHYGGLSPTRSDLLGVSASLADAEHVTRVEVSGGAATAIDFGFSFNVVTTTSAGGTEDDHPDTGRTVQGSLRQFLANAAAIAGANHMRFVPVTSPNASGSGGSWHQIAITNPLPAVTGDATTIDGTVYTTGGAIGDPNPGSIGSAATTPGFTVGVDGIALPTVARPDLELVGSGGVDHGLQVAGAASVEVRGLILRGFDTSAIELSSTTAALVTANVVGGLSDPGTGDRNGIGIEVIGGSDGTIGANYIASNGSVGINFPTSGSDWLVTGNELAGNGFELNWADQLRLVGGSDFLVSGNHIHDGAQIGIEIRVGVGSTTIVNNTISGNGLGASEIAGIRNINPGAVPRTIEANVITDNVGPGVLVSQDGTGDAAPSLTTITRNRFGGNGGLAVDLTTSNAGRTTGDGPNPLSGNACGTGTDANEGIDRPVLSGAYAPGPYVRITGSACPDGVVEFFTAAPDGDGSDSWSGTDYGEPITHVGTATVAADGTLDTILAAGLSPGDVITALVTDPSGNTSEPAANVTVAPANIPAITVLGADPIPVEAGAAYSDPGATATDVEDGDLTGAIVTVDPVDPWALGTYTVTYDVTDSDGFPAVGADRTVTVADTTAPVLTLNGSAAPIFEGGSPYVDPGATASDTFEGDLTSSIVVVGVVDAFSLGPQTLTYSVSDSSGNGASATRTVTVVDTTAPVLTLSGSTSLVITQHSTYVDAGASATDLVDGDLTAAIVVTGSVDTAVIGTYLLRFDVQDASGNAAPQAVRTVVVSDPNPPQITIIGPNPATVEAHDTYADQGATAFDLEDGDLTDEMSTSIRVDSTTPGTYRVRYTVTDESGNRTTATRTVNVVDTTPPQISLVGNDPVTVVAGHPFTDPGATAVDLVDGDLTDAIQVAGPVDTALPGTVTLTYRVRDAAGNLAEATRSVRVLPNQAPVAAADSYLVAQGEVLSVRAPGLLSNDLEPDGENLTAVLVSSPTHGTLALEVDGSFTYRHSGVRIDSDAFVYEIRDGYGNTDRATVTIDVTLENQPPEANPDTVVMDEDGVTVLDPLLNDSDPDGDRLTVVSVSRPESGAAWVIDGEVGFRAAADWSGVVRLTYTVTDGIDESTGTIVVTVLATNDAPRPSNDTFTVSSWERHMLSVLDNDRDPEGDVLTIVSVSTPMHGTAEVADGGLLAYTPSVGLEGTDSFTYTITDEAGETATAMVTVEIERPAWVASAIVDGSGPLIVAAGAQGAGGLPGVRSGAVTAEVIILFVGAFLQQLLAHSVHLGLLVLALVWFVLFGYSQWWRAAARGRQYAVVLLDREDRLPVMAAPGSNHEVHRFDAAERRIRSLGRRRSVDGVLWVPVEIPDGRGWVEGRYLTEDAAKATFERDITGSRLLTDLGRALAAGRRPELSPRGAINPMTMERVSGNLALETREAQQLAAAIADPSTRYLVDRPSAPDSLRPAQLRNFHWVTVVVDGGPVWHVIFEYHRDRPMVVAVRREGARLPRLV